MTVNYPTNPVKATLKFANQCAQLEFANSNLIVYNPLIYAWQPHLQYLEKYASAPKTTLFLGMNPGPWGMAQTGIPFGEITAVRDWLNIKPQTISPPPNEIPARPIQGFDCKRSEVSGKRLWRELFAKQFVSADEFFKDHMVLNYCPLLFTLSDRDNKKTTNITPDKLPTQEQENLQAICDAYLAHMIEYLQAKVIIGVGKYAEKRIKSIHAKYLTNHKLTIGSIMHPSPANPSANKGNWDQIATSAWEKIMQQHKKS